MANPEVGKIYEIGINGVGYMLDDDPATEMSYRSLSAVLEPQRFADGATPVSESIERYSFVNSSEWRGGSGQRFANRDNSDLSSFFDSAGVDPFAEDQRLRLLPRLDKAVDNGNPDLFCVAGSRYLLNRSSAAISAATVNVYSVSGNTVTNDPSGAVGLSAITDLDIGYGRGFYATGTDLRATIFGSAGQSTLSTLDIYRVAWIGDRLAVIYRDSATSTWRFSTLTTAGAEEIGGGLLTLPGANSATMTSCQYRIGAIAPGLGFTWFSGWTQDGDEAYVYVWGNDTTLSASIAMAMPKGEIPLDMLFYQGGLYIYAVAANQAKAKIYRCVTNGDGTLTPFLLVEDAGAAPTNLDRPGRMLAAGGRNVYFAWNSMVSAGLGGCGVIDLGTGGFAKRCAAPAGDTGDVNSVYVWGNRPGIAVAGRGLYLEHPSTLLSVGSLTTSTYDADSALDKRWDTISMSVDPAASSTVEVEYSIDGGTTWVDAITANATAQALAAVDVDAPSLAMRINLVGNGTVGPAVRVVSAKFHPLGLLDRILQLPVNCSDKAEGLNGAALPYAKGSGMARARTLQGLMGNYVEIQDVDWHVTGTTELMEIIQVDIRGFRSALDPVTRTNRSGQVAVVTARASTDPATLAALVANRLPVVTNPGPRTGNVGVAITPLQLAATDADSDALSWGAKNLPAGLGCNPNGLITGTPTLAGVRTVTVNAFDGTAMGTATFTFTIT